MHSVFTEVHIAATPQAVWSTLTDLAAYPAWNRVIRKMTGEPRKGAPWQMEINSTGESYMDFDLTVTEWLPGERLTWRSGLFAPWLYTGLHDFRLSTVAGGTRLIQSETYSGLLAPVLLPFFKTRTTALFTRMNEALKAEVERRNLLVGWHK